MCIRDRLCTDIWGRAEDRLGGGVDHTEIVRYLEEIGGAGED